MNDCIYFPKQRPLATKLTKLEEKSFSFYIFDLDSREFALRLADIENIANYLLEIRRRKRVGKF